MSAGFAGAKMRRISGTAAFAVAGMLSPLAHGAVIDTPPELMPDHYALVGEVACPVQVASTPPCDPSVTRAPAGSTTYTVRTQFRAGQAKLDRDDRRELDALIAQLKGHDIERIELVGHTDSQRVGHPETVRLFKDNYGLSRARATVVGDYLAQSLGLVAAQVTASGRGPDEPLTDNGTPAGRAKNRRIEVRIFERVASAPASCAAPAAAPAATRRAGLPNVRVLLEDGTSVTTDKDGLFHFEGIRAGTHVVQLDPESLPPGHEAVARIQDTRFAGRPSSQFVDVRGPGAWRADFEVCPTTPAPEPPVQEPRGATGGSRMDGDNLDFLAGQAPGVEWVFPPAHYVPRMSMTRLAIKHLPGQVATLKYIPGESVHPLTFEGTRISADGQVAVSSWRGAALVEGINRFEAVVTQAGQKAQTLEREVAYSNLPARAEWVPEASALVSDGIHKPVIAVRLFDSTGQPLRAGATGSYTIDPPFVPAELAERQQQRQLAGLDRFQPTWRIEGDDGLAYIELAPTHETGAAILNFTFRPTPWSSRRQEVRAWVESKPRDWVVVGFAEGTVGYNTLKRNQQALAEDGPDDGTYTDGKVSLYAKGRVLGRWLLTLAYDSDKEEERRRRKSLLSTIDPQSYYTLYGDGTEQRYDASSQDKLYLKLEREQFYALFGDYDTDLTQGTLTRYRRTLQGVKAEYGGNGPLQVTAFAADTPLGYARDEIQGNGTSGLYRLHSGNIVLNSERITIETRDRFRSEQVRDSRALLRHIDYDIDYDAGTIFFREPVYSRDASFNPRYIVAEYETWGVAAEEVNAGGRVGTTLPAFGGTFSGGVTAVHDHSSTSQQDLGGIDLKLRLPGDTEVRLERAASEGSDLTGPRKGDAGLFEVEHHGEAFDVLAYARHQEPQFGLNQQNASETGMRKIGADGRLGLTEHVSLSGQAYRQDNLSSEAQRQVLAPAVEYRNDDGALRLGGLYARDEAGSGLLAGRSFESTQVSAAANRYFFDRALEVSGQADQSVDGNDDSVDFPSRYQLGVAYAVTDDVKLLAAEEVTDGEAFESTMTRIGLQATPWKGARLTSTVNQVDMGEYGPRSFGLFGLTQALLLGERWGADFGVDTSRAFSEGSAPILQVNPSQPIASGGYVAAGTLTEDFVAVTGGLTYRDTQWSWNGRAESRNGETSNRYGFATNFLRQAQAGVAVSLNAQAFRVGQTGGMRGHYGTAGIGWAWRPLGSRFSVLDRFELRYDQLENGSGVAGSGLFGANSLTVTGNATSRRLINNFALNRVSREWTAEDRQGDLFRASQRQQWSFYYGGKYAFERFNGEEDDGYIDLIGLEWRRDVRSWIDIGLQATVLHEWNVDNYRYAFGPQVGVTPVTNGWITFGYNFQGFRDRDFDAARYSAQGPYLALRFKFDQETRW